MTITLGDAADIHYMIEKEIASIEFDLEHALRHKVSVSEEWVKMMKNRIESYREFQKKFDL